MMLLNLLVTSDAVLRTPSRVPRAAFADRRVWRCMRSIKRSSGRVNMPRRERDCLRLVRRTMSGFGANPARHAFPSPVSQH